MRVSIFQSKEMEIEFKELVNEIIPSLNECVNCNIFECKCCYNFTVNCSSYRKLKCKNCEKYKRTKEILFQNYSNKSLDCIVNFLIDLFKISDYSIDFFNDLKPINDEVKRKKDFFLIENDAKKHIFKEQYSNGKIIYYFKGRKYRLFSKHILKNIVVFFPFFFRNGFCQH